MPTTKRREEECKYSFLPIEGFLSLCELAMNLSSHQFVVSWKERSKLRYACELDLDLFFKFIKISELICELKISFDLLYNSGCKYTQPAF